MMVVNCYLLLIISGLLDHVEGVKIVTKMDLKKGFGLDV
jgi:hypothetical protein